MKELKLIVNNKSKLFKFIKSGINEYHVITYTDDIAENEFEIVLMPTDNTEQLPRYTIQFNPNMPTWVKSIDVIDALNKHIKSNS